MDYLRTYSWITQIKALIMFRFHLWFFAINMVLGVFGHSKVNFIYYLVFAFFYFVGRTAYTTSVVLAFFIVTPAWIFFT